MITATPTTEVENRSQTATRRRTTRSAVTNGTRPFVCGDGNSPWARRWKDLIELHVSDRNGRELLSEAQVSMIKRAAAIETELEQLEGKMSLGETVDLDLYFRGASHLRRIFEVLGIERRTRDLTPSLLEYLAAAVEQAPTEPAGASFDPAPSADTPNKENSTDGHG
jgi:hypothetical protein